MKMNPASLDLTSLSLLLAVCEERNLARVAARENIAVSSVSRRIRNLELRLGVSLFDRHDRGLDPTPAALMVADRVRGALGLLDQAIDELADVRDGCRGLVRVQAHATAAISILPKLLASFLGSHPYVDVSVVEATSVEILHSIRQGVCDLGLISGTVKAGDLNLIPWLDDELLAVLPEGHPLSMRRALTFEDLIAYPLIAMQRDSALVALQRAAALGLGKMLNERAHVSSFEVALAMIREGLGVALFPAAVVGSISMAGGVAARRLADPWAKRKIVICTRIVRDATTDALVAHLRGVVHGPVQAKHEPSTLNAALED